MIYLDNSVALAHLLAEDRFPPDELEFTPALAGRNQSERIGCLIYPMMIR